MSRKIVFGDIHGALRALTQIIEAIRPVHDDEFVFLGDYVDGWPDSAQVVAYLLAFSERCQCTFIKGNHDLWCEYWLKGFPADSIWLKHGGRATIQSYASIPDADRFEHIAFFENLRHYVVDESNSLFIHAGYATDEGPEYEFRNGRYTWDRTLWEQALQMQLREFARPSDHPSRFSKYKEIYIGHTPTIFYDIAVPFHALNVWNLDTGAAFDGRLSALEINSGKIWQSEIVPKLYPGITGRVRF